MALDEMKAQAQLIQLGRALSEAEEAGRGLSAYRRKLNQSWSAGEVTYFNRTIDDLSARCSQLERSLEALRRDMQRALEDIQAEEAQAEAAAQQTEG